MNPNYRVFLPCLAIVLALSLLVSPAYAADVVVGNGPGTCDDAALDAALAAAGPGDTVKFNCGPAFVTIPTANTKFISRDTTIDGGGLIALDGQGTHGVLEVRLGATLNMKGLQVQNGRSSFGGGAFVSGTLNVSDSRFTGNVTSDGGGGAIYSDGRLDVSDTMFDGNRTPSIVYGGGGILSRGVLAVSRSTFVENTADRGSTGGAIEAHNTSSIISSSFIGNSAWMGGGIFLTGGWSPVLTNNTFSGNRGVEGGAIHTETGSATLTNNTFSGNSAPIGANIYSPVHTHITFLNNILANPAGGGRNCSSVTSVDAVGNLDSDGSCGVSTPELTGVDPLLAPLDYWGGPTQTFALCTGAGTPEGCMGRSPAIDAGNNTGCPATDQRGVERPQNGTCDIGAYELKQNDPPQCGLAVASPATLWPANHKLSPVSILGVSDPNNDQVTLTVTAITQDEPASAGGDAAIQNGQLLLRADRDGKGNGRVYRVSFDAADGQGGTCRGQVSVCVPHDQSKLTCIDDGQRYRSQP